MEATPVQKNQIKEMQIKASVIPNINLALQQNAFPVITNIVLENLLEDDFSSVELLVSSSPGFLIDRAWSIEKIRVGEQITIDDCYVELQGDYLREITESLKGEIRFILKQGDRVLAKSIHDVQLLSKDEWGGMTVLPEIVAAFVQRVFKILCQPSFSHNSI